MRLRILAGAIAALTATAAVVIPAGAQSGARAASTHTVTLKSLRFHPGSLSIHRGDSVKWVWQDTPIEHNVTGRGFKSRTMARGSFTVRFNHKGTFAYRCTIHAFQGMRGKIVVH